MFFIEDCVGRELTIDGVATILYRNHKVSESASATAARIFLENAAYIGYLNSENVFNVDRTSEVDLVDGESEEQQQIVPEQQVSYLPPPTAPTVPKSAFIAPPIPIFLDEGVAELYLPNGFKKQDIERVIKVLKAYVE